ncbi:MAG: carboxy terminal-processing peptidase, partial [Gammaproteobacteria bacterium]|nr:carboxy terminal-processing peptidase [Gammaproteobacteria bacterium]
EVQQTLDKRYRNFLRRARQVKSGDVFDIFINAYANTMDPHTEYFSPRDSEEFQIRMSLSYEGIGAALQSVDEYVTVMRILPGGSADKTGLLKPNDRITGVAQKDSGEMVDVIGWRLDDVVQIIRGPTNSIVRLRVLAAGDAPGSPEKEIRLVRSKIKLEEQAAQKKIVPINREDAAYKVGVIKIPAFYLDFQARMAGEENYRSTTRDVRKLLMELQEEKVDGVIVDLRNNGGGSLQEATELTGLFIDQGPVVQVRNSRGRLEVAEDEESGIIYNGPLMVLVNRFSASASEIFAGAIQDYGRGLVVGSTTFGKGTVQNLVNLNQFWKSNEVNLGQLKLTVGKFYRVTGSSTQHQGVIPDIALPSVIDPEVYGESAQDSALPWDQVGPAAEIEREPTHDLVELLQSSHMKRSADNELFSLFMEDIQENRESANRKEISLVLSKRITEQDDKRQADLERINAQRAALGLPVADSEEELEELEEEQHDLLLTEAAELLIDQIDVGAGDLGLATKLVPADHN